MYSFTDQNFRELYRRLLATGAGGLPVATTDVQVDDVMSAALTVNYVAIPTLKETCNNFASAVLVQVQVPAPAAIDAADAAFMRISAYNPTVLDSPSLYITNNSSFFLDINTWRHCSFKWNPTYGNGNIFWQFFRCYDSPNAGSINQG